MGFWLQVPGKCEERLSDNVAPEHLRGGYRPGFQPLQRSCTIHPIGSSNIAGRTLIGLLQRVSSASVTVNNETIASIGQGLLVLVGIEREDAVAQTERLAERLLNYRVFEDSEGRMNLDVTQVGGGVLLVPQFTLVADTGKGNRPSFSSAADPEHGRTLFDELVEQLKSRWTDVAAGQFGANMAVQLVNQGPVTFWLQVPPNARRH